MSPDTRSETVRALAARIHLDAVGGIAGDMFAAALVDTFPELEAGLLAAVAALPTPAGATVTFVGHRDAVLGGRRFVVTDPSAANGGHAHGGGRHHHDHGHDHAHGHAHGHDGGGEHGHHHHHHEHDHAHAHDHSHDHAHSHEHAHDHSHDHAHAHAHVHHDYASIRVMLDRAPLAPSVRAHALGLFRVLAEAEASVHGMAVDRVSFHEVGAWDSIVDFVAAAYLIDAAGSARFTWSALPIGGGRIQSAHGVLPVPAPATTLLLRGMAMVDDGVPGERVTPTGAAILRYLHDNGHGPADRTPVVAANTGFGFGTRTMRGLSNVLRCIAFDPAPGASESSSAAGAHDERVTMLNFEIDDQSGEDLAVALDRLRAAPGVLDVMQSAMVGKKGRLVAAVQLQVESSQVNTVADLVFLETTTLGLRISDVARRVLPRVAVGASADGNARAKVAQRPAGVVTAKAEIDDVAAIAGHAERERVRAVAATRALSAYRN